MWWKALSLLLQLAGFVRWAETTWEKHKAQEAKNAGDKIITASDSDVDKQLRDKFTRD